MARNPKFLGLDHKKMYVCCAESSIDRDVCWCPEIFLTVQGRRRFLSRSSVKDVAMFATMTAVMGLVGAAIFLAHAFEGLRSRV